MRVRIILALVVLMVLAGMVTTGHAASVCLQPSNFCPVGSTTDGEGVIWLRVGQDQATLHTTSGTVVPAVALTGVVFADSYTFVIVEGHKEACVDYFEPGGCAAHGVPTCIPQGEVVEVCV